MGAAATRRDAGRRRIVVMRAACFGLFFFRKDSKGSSIDWSFEDGAGLLNSRALVSPPPLVHARTTHVDPSPPADRVAAAPTLEPNTQTTWPRRLRLVGYGKQTDGWVVDASSAQAPKTRPWTAQCYRCETLSRSIRTRSIPPRGPSLGPKPDGSVHLPASVSRVPGKQRRASVLATTHPQLLRRFFLRAGQQASKGVLRRMRGAIEGTARPHRRSMA